MNKKDRTEPEPGDLLGGTLNILGLQIDLGTLLNSPEEVKERLAELREKLKAAGGREALSDDEWKRGGVGISGHIRTHGPLGEREFHVGTTGKPRRTGADRPTPEPQAPVEPPVDVFDEGDQVIIVADVPGVSLDELELKVEGRAFTLSTRPTARRSYRKELLVEAELDPESVRATCRNGVLEARVGKMISKGP